MATEHCCECHRPFIQTRRDQVTCRRKECQEARRKKKNAENQREYYRMRMETRQQGGGDLARVMLMWVI